MKKIKLLTIMFLSFILFNQSVIAGGWGEIGSGDPYGEGSSSSCGSSPGCHCRWNNGRYGALKFTIIYYDGNYRHVLGSPVAYYNTPSNASYSWVPNVIKGAKHKSWLPWTSATNSNSQKIEDALIGGSQKEKGYPIIKEIFSDIGVNYNQLLAAVNSNGTYKDGGKEYTNMVNEKIGTKGVSTKGIRVVVEPIVTIQSTGKCSSYKPIVSRGFTVKNLFKTYYGKKDSGKEVLNNNSFVGFSTLLWLEKGDAGYNQASATADLSKVASDTSGWGLNIYGPFDDASVEVCDPDEDYDGYDSGVEYCCKSEDITPDDTSNNKTPEEGGNLKRPLTEEEINNECAGNGDKCDPKIDGVDECCVKCSVSPGHLENNKESDCMTGPIDLTELENSVCNKNTGKDCEYALEQEIPSTCDKKNTGKLKDIASWECTFNSTENDKVKNHYYDGAENDYCAIFCKEEVNSIFPPSGLTIEQGRFFIVGEVAGNIPSVTTTMGPISYKGKKTCRVTDEKGSSTGKINKEQFEKDMEDVEKEIKENWDEWKTLEAKQKACTSGSGSYDGKSYTCELDEDGNKPNYSSKIAEAKKNYEKAEKERKEHIDHINACTEFAESRDYKFEPVVDFEYKEPTYGVTSDGSVKSWTLDIVENTKTDTIKYSKTGDAKAEEISGSDSIEYVEEKMYKCSGDEPCKKEEDYKYPDVLWWETVKDVEIKYGLPENTYRYISKATARSFDSKDEAGGDNSIDMGVPNLPIHVSTMPGYYDYRFITKTFGTGNKFNPYMFEAKPFNSVDYEQIEDYSCKFQVSCYPPLIVGDLDDYCEVCEDQKVCETPSCIPGEPGCDTENCPPDDPDCDGNPGTGPDCDPNDPDCDKNTCPPNDPDCNDKPGGENPGTGPDCDPNDPDCDKNTCPPNDPDCNENPGGGNPGGDCDPTDPDCDKPCPPNNPDCDKNTCPPDNPDCNENPGGGNPGGGGSSGGDCPSGDPDCSKGTGLGVELVYRTVSLYAQNQAFPGTTGSGREPGVNWNSNQINSFILNSRGAEGYDIYKKSPMYEITLTPSLIKEIREYNKEKNGKLITIYDGATKSTGIAGYGDYDSMKCLGNGTTCVSSTIRTWGVHGCGIQDGSLSNYNKCSTELDDPWGTS